MVYDVIHLSYSVTCIVIIIPDNNRTNPVLYSWFMPGLCLCIN